MKGAIVMKYRPGDIVWYAGQFSSQEYEGLVRAISTPQPPAAEATYLLTLLSGPYAGQTSVVYERELHPKRAQEVAAPSRR